MKRLLGLLVASLLGGAALWGCGNDAGFQAVVVIDQTPPTFTVAPGSSVGVTGPIQIKVQKSLSDATPVPFAKISIYGGGASVGPYFNGTDLGYLWKDQFASKLAGNGFQWNTQTDEAGALQIFLYGTADLCVSTTDITGGLSLSAVVAASTGSFDIPVTITCST